MDPFDAERPAKQDIILRDCSIATITQMGGQKQYTGRTLQLETMVLASYQPCTALSSRDGFVKTLLFNSKHLFTVLIHPYQEINSQELGNVKAGVTLLCHFFQCVAAPTSGSPNLLPLEGFGLNESHLILFFSKPTAKDI